MKLKNKIIWGFFSIFVGVGIVHAAPTSSFYASSNYIESGSKVTATLRINNVAAWNVQLEGNGSTSGCKASYADATSNGGNTTKYLTVTCTATSIGQISLRVTGDATSADGSTSAINSVKVVTVTAPREKDTNNFLKSLGIKDYQITPEFNKDTLEYNVEVPSTVNKVTIEGSAASNYANVAGLGEVEVNEGANAFEIKVTSETGSERIYKLTINVKDENPIEVKINNNTYTIMKNAKTIEIPSTYEATTIKIKDFDIPAFYSETSKFTLVGVKDTKGTTHLAIYDKEKDIYQLYNENKSDQLLLYIESIPEIQKGFIKSTVNINKTTYECLKPSNESKITIIYAMNIVTGKKNYYLYDETLNTYTIYNDEINNTHLQTIEKYKTVIVALGGIVIFTILIIMILLLRKPKQKKITKEEIKINKIDVNKEEQNDELTKEKEDKKTKKEKKKEKKAKKNKEQEVVGEIKETPPIKKETSTKQIKSTEDAMNQVDEATKIIEEFEKTMKINKKDLEEAKNDQKSTKEIEATMYDIFSEEKQKKKKKRK